MDYGDILLGEETKPKEKKKKEYVGDYGDILLGGESVEETKPTKKKKKKKTGGYVSRVEPGKLGAKPVAAKAAPGTKPKEDIERREAPFFSLAGQSERLHELLTPDWKDVGRAVVEGMAVPQKVGYHTGMALSNILPGESEKKAQEYLKKKKREVDIIAGKKREELGQTIYGGIGELVGEAPLVVGAFGVAGKVPGLATKGAVFGKGIPYKEAIKHLGKRVGKGMAAGGIVGAAEGEDVVKSALTWGAIEGLIPILGHGAKKVLKIKDVKLGLGNLAEAIKKNPKEAKEITKVAKLHPDDEAALEMIPIVEKIKEFGRTVTKLVTPFVGQKSETLLGDLESSAKFWQEKQIVEPAIEKKVKVLRDRLDELFSGGLREDMRKPGFVGPMPGIKGKFSKRESIVAFDLAEAFQIIEGRVVPGARNRSTPKDLDLIEKVVPYMPDAPETKGAKIFTKEGGEYPLIPSEEIIKKGIEIPTLKYKTEYEIPKFDINKMKPETRVEYETLVSRRDKLIAENERIDKKLRVLPASPIKTKANQKFLENKIAIVDLKAKIKQYETPYVNISKMPFAEREDFKGLQKSIQSLTRENANIEKQMKGREIHPDEGNKIIEKNNLNIEIMSDKIKVLQEPHIKEKQKATWEIMVDEIKEAGSTAEAIEQTFIKHMGEVPPMVTKAVKDFRWRYTPEQAKRMIEEAPPHVQRAAIIVRGEFDRLKVAYDIKSDIEAYVRREWNTGIINNAVRLFQRKPIFTKRKAASWEQYRTGAEGYVKDLAKVSKKVLPDMEIELARRNMMATLERQLAKVAMKEPPRGWSPYKIQYDKDRLGETIFVPNATIKYIARGRRAQFADDAVEAMFNSVHSGIKSAGLWWKIMALTASPATTVTNALGSGIQYTLKGMKDLSYLPHDKIVKPELLKGDVRQLMFDIWGVGQGFKDMYADVLTKLGSKSAKPGIELSLLGGRRGRATTELGERGFWESPIGRVAETGLYPMIAIDDFLKRILFYATTGNATRNIAKKIEDGVASETEKILYLNGRSISGKFGLAYENNPVFIDTLKQHGTPFISYIYNAGRMMSSMTPFGVKDVSVLHGDILKFEGKALRNPEAHEIYNRLIKKNSLAGRLSEEEIIFMKEFQFRDSRERIAGTIALGMAITGLAIAKQINEHYSPHGELGNPPDKPYELSTRGRFYIGTKNGKALYARGAKYMPFLWAGAETQRALYFMARGNRRKGADLLDEAFTQFTDEAIGMGPLADLGLMMVGQGTKYDMYKSKGARTGELAASYTPFQRPMQDIARKYEASRTEGKIFQYKRPTFISAATQNIPVVSWYTRGEPKEEPLTGKQREIDPDLFAWRMLGGLNIKPVDLEALEKWADNEGASIFGKDFRTYIKRNFIKREDYYKLDDELEKIKQQIETYDVLKPKQRYKMKVACASVIREQKIKLRKTWDIK